VYQLVRPVFPGKTEAETLEALACREAIALAYYINARSVRVASEKLRRELWEFMPILGGRSRCRV
jgi:hypothetical protein